MTPKVAGLKRCFPRGRIKDFERIAADAAAGWTQRLSARSNSVRLSPVMIALRYERGASGRIPNERCCAVMAAAKVRIICAVVRLKSRNHAPAASRMPRNRIWKILGSLNAAGSFQLHRRSKEGILARIVVHGLLTYERRSRFFLQDFYRVGDSGLSSR